MSDETTDDANEGDHVDDEATTGAGDPVESADDEVAATDGEEDEDEDDDEDEPDALSRTTLIVGAVVIAVVIGIVGVLIATSGGGDGGGGGSDQAEEGDGGGDDSNVAIFGSTDSFDRAESADSLGNMPDGRAWLVDAGTWGIAGNQAAVTESARYRNHAVVGIGQGDGGVQVRMPKVVPGAGLVFRYEGPYNYWALVAVPEVATWNIYKVVDGTREIVGNTGESQTRDGTTIAVRTNGDTIELIVNGRVAKSIVDDFGQDNGRFGLTVPGGRDALTARFDDFIVGLPDGSPPPAAGDATPPGTGGGAGTGGGGGGSSPTTAAP